MIKYLVAGMSHIPSFVELAKEHRAESTQVNCANMDEVVLSRNLAYAIGNKDNDLIMVALDGERVIGYIWIVAVTFPFSSTIVGNLQYFYVQKDYRKGSVSARLLNHAWDICNLSKVEEMQIAFASGLDGVDFLSKRAESIGSVYSIPIKGNLWESLAAQQSSLQKQ